MKYFILIITFFVLQVVYAQDSVHTSPRENLGPNINTKNSEMSPIISSDGKTLYFCVENHPLNTLYSRYSDTDDIWYSELDTTTGKWGKAKHMPFPFNQESLNSIESISADGSVFYIRGAYQDGDFIGKGFSFILKTSTGWSKPQQLNILNFDKISKGLFTCFHMSPDNKTLILGLSNKKDDELNDLYVCFKTGPNQWSEPQYIKSLNTKNYTETTPFLAYDNKTMYFSSDRPGGKGNWDIWMSTRLDDTWLKWSEPVNLDSLNTPEGEGYYSIDAKGKYAYIGSTKDAFGLIDIFRIKLTNNEKPNPVVVISGRVLNSKTQQPIYATITYNSLTTGKEIGQALSDPVTGKYNIILPYGTQYSFNANSTNYISVSNHLDLTTPAAYKEIKKDLLLVPIETGQIIPLSNIFFDSKSTLRDESTIELDHLYSLLIANPTMEIEINGHTDNAADAVLNNQLSLDRAAAVKKYLVGKGIADKRILAKGFGSSKPAAANNAEDADIVNSRVEFIILKL